MERTSGVVATTGRSFRTNGRTRRRTDAKSIRRHEPIRPPPHVRRSDEFVPRRGQSLSRSKSDTRRSVSWLTGHRPMHTFPGAAPIGDCPVAAARFQTTRASRSPLTVTRIAPESNGKAALTAFPVPARSGVLHERLRAAPLVAPLNERSGGAKPLRLPPNLTSGLLSTFKHPRIFGPSHGVGRVKGECSDGPRLQSAAAPATVSGESKPIATGDMPWEGGRDA